MTPPDRLTVETAREAGARVVALHGDLDVATVPLLCSTLAAARGGRERRLVLDLAGVTSLDLWGAAAIEVGRRILADRGVGLFLRGPRDEATRTLRLAGYSIAVVPDDRTR